MKWELDKEGIFSCGFDKAVSYPEAGTDNCFNIEDQSPWFNQRNELILALVERHNLNGNFLDIGGGNGFQSRALLTSQYKGQVYLIEPSYEGCLNAKKRGIQNVYSGVFQDFDFNTNSIGVCGLFDVIEHIKDDILFLNELYEKLPKNGIVMINVPAFNFLWADADIHAGHFRRYNKRDVERIERLTKFKIIDNGYYFSFYYLPLFLLRVVPYRLGLRKSLNQTLQSETQNHSKHGVIQKLLNKRHNYWLKQLKRGKPAPFGTSMFIILEK